MIKLIQLTLCLVILSSCGQQSRFPLDKRYWDVNDYDQVIFEIEFKTPEGEAYPSLSDPELSPVFNKLVDKENVSVVVTDEALGLRHRSQFAEEMFEQCRDLTKIYSVMDREDKFVYDREFVETLKFMLFVEIHYFKLGNEVILEEADDPNSTGVKNIIQNNEEVITKNFNYYLDYINKEKSFSEEAIISFANGIDVYFAELIQKFPQGNFRSVLNKTDLMLKKASNPRLIQSLTSLKVALEKKTQVNTAS